MFFGGISSADEPYYEVIGLEIASGNLRVGLWARCMADAKFDENRAKTNYVKQRVKELKSERALRETQIKLDDARGRLSETGVLLERLDLQESQIFPALCRRFMIFVIGALIGSVVGIVVDNFTPIIGLPVEGTCIACAVLGLVATWFTLLFVPSQQETVHEAARIRNERRAVMARSNEAEETIRRLRP